MKPSWQDDFTYYYYNKAGQLVEAAKLSQVPEHVEEYVKLHTAVSFVQKLGCAGMSQHIIKDSFHQLCLDVLRVGVEKHGVVFPELLRGTRSDRPDSEHKILFGTRDRSVAEFYGTVKTYCNVKGLLTVSGMQSVDAGDYSKADEEIIFFPQQRR